MPEKSFFVYFAPGATHAPHHVPKEWSDRCRGKFDQGADDYDHLISPEERLHLAMMRQ
jgi:arylsulfatase